MLEIFKYENKQVRTVQESNTSYFVAKDVTEILGYKDSVNAIKSHCRGVVKYHPISDNLGRVQNVRVIPEPDIYRLVMKSKLPAAMEFENWVTSEVLPSVRKTGSYSMGNMSPAELTLRLAEHNLDHEKRIVALEEKVKTISYTPYTPTTKAIAAPTKRISTDDRVSVKDFAVSTGIALSAKDSRTIGRMVASACRHQGIKKETILSSPRSNTPIMVYPKDILKSVFKKRNLL